MAVLIAHLWSAPLAANTSIEKQSLVTIEVLMTLHVSHVVTTAAGEMETM